MYEQANEHGYKSMCFNNQKKEYHEFLKYKYAKNFW